MVDTNYCWHRLPCGRCKLTMNKCPEVNGDSGITWTSTWPDKSNEKMTLFSDKDYPFMTTTTPVAEEGMDIEKKMLRC